MMVFNFSYFRWAIVLLVTEILIAAYMHDAFIRPTFGDFLVVLLMYCAIRSILQVNYRVTTLVVLFIAYVIEVSQYFHLLVRLGLQHFTLAKLILGSGFSWGDMVAYTLAAALIWVIENRGNNTLQTQ